jgi:lipopolysaccharide transport system permease protein
MANNLKSNLERTITPEAKINLIVCFRSLWSYREVLYTLAIREIKVRYKQTVLGVAWAIIQPLSLTILFTIIFGKFARMPTEGIPYPIFAYSALLPWTFFATAISFAIPSLVQERSLLMKVYLPREIFPVSCVLAACVDFGIAAIIFIAMIFFYRVSITIYLLWVVPLLLIQIIFTMGISLFFSSINARYRDVRYALPLVVQLWMFATPIFYPTSVIPVAYRMIYMLNPMAGIIDGYRRVIIQGVRPELRYVCLSAIISILLLILAYHYFKRSEREFIDVI